MHSTYYIVHSPSLWFDIYKYICVFPVAMTTYVTMYTTIISYHIFYRLQWFIFNHLK